MTYKTAVTILMAGVLSVLFYLLVSVVEVGHDDRNPMDYQGYQTKKLLKELE